jgi:mRNA interferase MazF
VKLERGTVALVTLDPTVGHEQRGRRPCVIVSDPDVTADQRFGLVAVVPVSGAGGEGALYPALAPGRSGLRKKSFALVDQIRSVDKRRVDRIFGRIPREELDAIDLGLSLFLGLG